MIIRIVGSADATFTSGYEWLVKRAFTLTDLPIVEPVYPLLRPSAALARTILAVFWCTFVIATFWLLGRVRSGNLCWIPVFQVLLTYLCRNDVNFGFVSFDLVGVALRPGALVHEPLNTRHRPLHFILRPMIGEAL